MKRTDKLVSETFIRNPGDAFENAIAKGMASGEYMYMYSTRNRDYFKNIITRDYINYEIR